MQFPVTIPIGPFQLHPHILFESLAYLVGFQTFLWLRRWRGETLAEGQRPLLILAAIAGALLGSKVLALLVDPVHVWEHRGTWQAWVEGKTIVGGLLGGWLAVELGKQWMGITRSTGDLYAIPLALGIAVGRLGCFLTGLGDRTYGNPTSLPWGVDFGDGMLRHPTQLYELLFLCALAVLLLRGMVRSGLREGDLFKLFLVGYLAWRFLVGFLQPHPYTLLGLGTLQWASLAGVVMLARHLPRLLGSFAARGGIHAD